MFEKARISYNGPAILNAVKEANKTGQVKIIAFDEEDETLAGVKQGAIFATVVQQPHEFGYQAIKLMYQYLKGDKSAVPATKQVFLLLAGVCVGAWSSVDEACAQSVRVAARVEPDGLAWR
ncbi:MAG TPA: substrate-binding domain-containing protein [Pyrinomonadaceae bacterium]